MIRGAGLALLVVASAHAQSEDYLRMDPKQASGIALGARMNGQVGRALDFRVISTDRSYNYKLRATWMTPDVIRAVARLKQLEGRLTDDATRQLVSDAETPGETVILIEIDPREGSGVIPKDWLSWLSPRASSGQPQRTAAGKESPALRNLAALAGAQRRDYAYDVFWAVFSLQTERGEPLFTPDEREAELAVRIYDKIGHVRWPVPESIRASLRAATPK